jgi:3-methyladenine DNA glycosylase AlkD
VIALTTADEIKQELHQYIDDEKAAFLPRFFKTSEGEYGEGDRFIGVTVPHQRKVAKRYYKHIDLSEVEMLLKEPVHEYRFTGLVILVYKFEKAKDEDTKKVIVDVYLKNIDAVNNWDLVDATAPQILGSYLFEKDKSLLYDFAKTPHLWKQRIAIMSTFYFIKQGNYDDTLKIAEILLHHEHDLIHKAVGWMLREIGNRDFEVEYNFLKAHYRDMPRTMLRYAIEKFEPNLRQSFLKGLE